MRLEGRRALEVGWWGEGEGRPGLRQSWPGHDRREMNRYYEGYPRILPPPPLAEPSATWASYASDPARSHERFKPERVRQGLSVQKLQWRASNWVDGFPEMVSSMTIADVSPRFAVKRIILLYENAQYREAANFINRLSHGTFKTILGQLPIDLFIEAMPHSVSILEALYAKVFLSSDCGIKVLRPDCVLMQLVKLFAGAGNAERWLGSARKLLKVIVLSEPKLKKALQVKRRSLDKAVEGLGQHGLVGTTDESLTNLHDALKVEFQRLVDTYKTALQKLEELSLSGKKDGKANAPVQASHQRQLSLRQSDIQERLIKNKTLLNVVEPATSNRSVAILLAILQRRVECDKDALFQFTQLRKELKVESEQVVAPLLMRYSHACDQVCLFLKVLLTLNVVLLIKIIFSQSWLYLFNWKIGLLTYCAINNDFKRIMKYFIYPKQSKTYSY